MELIVEKSRVRSITNLLRIVFGLMLIITGADKFTNFLVYWPDYLNPIISNSLSLDRQTFMYIVGVIEIVVGIITLVRPQIGAYIVFAWLLAIIINLVTQGTFYDIALWDFAMSISAYSLGRLSSYVESRRRIDEPIMETHIHDTTRAA